MFAMGIDACKQDSKGIPICPKGKPTDFQTKDKCGASTCRLLGMMARAVELEWKQRGARRAGQ